MTTALKLPRGMKFPAWALALSRLSLLPPQIDNLQFVSQSTRTYGDFFCVHLGRELVMQITNPDLVRELLVEKADKFHKGKLLNRAVRPIVGNGLLTSEDDFWKKQRKLAQPAFHFKRIENYGHAMVDEAMAVANTWRDGEVVDLLPSMSQLTLNIVCKTLFSADISAQAARAGELTHTLLEAANSRVRVLTTLYDYLPSRLKQREKAAQHEMDELILQIISDHRKQGTDKGDLLSMLLMATDENNGQGMSDQQLRDEVITLFLAGHETTAVTLTWTFALLGQNPQVAAKLHAELDSVLGGRAPTMADLANLPYTERVIKESMRLYPPAGGVERIAIEDTTLGGYDVPEGTTVFVSSYVMHRDARYFANPEAFDPNRWLPEHEASLHKYAYLPFGGGPRICIGNAFAMMEARLLLATLASRFELTLLPNQTIKAQQLFTVRPKYGVKAIAATRQPEAVMA